MASGRRTAEIAVAISRSQERPDPEPLHHEGDWDVCKPLLAALRPDMLCLADRGFNGLEHWRDASQTGAKLWWRCAGTAYCRG